jgi:hypothetical protein
MTRHLERIIGSIDTLAGRLPLTRRSRQPVVGIIQIDWHQIQVFKRHPVAGGS